jgi:hypothetical protein
MSQHCTTCGAEISDVQARTSQLRAEGAPQRCADCITAELTKKAELDDRVDPYNRLWTHSAPKKG